MRQLSLIILYQKINHCLHFIELGCQCRNLNFVHSLSHTHSVPSSFFLLPSSTHFLFLFFSFSIQTCPPLTQTQQHQPLSYSSQSYSFLLQRQQNLTTHRARILCLATNVYIFFLHSHMVRPHFKVPKTVEECQNWNKHPSHFKVPTFFFLTLASFQFLNVTCDFYLAYFFLNIIILYNWLCK